MKNLLLIFLLILSISAFSQRPGGKGGRGGKFKLPTLTELHEYLFQVPFSEAHNATADVEATTRCFFELIRREEFSVEDLQEADDFFDRFQEANPDVIQGIGLKHQNLK